MTRAAVFAGGGVGGIAWLLGMITALRADGVDLAAADVLIGTSAGSAVAAQLATDQLDAAAAMQQSLVTAEIAVQFDIAQFMATMQQVAAQATSRTDASRRIANIASFVPDVSGEQRRAAVAARLPYPHWPERDLRLVAVAQDTGERVVFDRTSAPSLVDAVTASCAVPGVWPPVTIDGRAYVDGGVHSSSNADLAAGAGRTVILVPGLVDDHLAELLAWERRRLEPGTSAVVSADQRSLDAIGPNPLDPACRPAAFAAGQQQARDVTAELLAFWG